jgi:hypothetical protein
MKSRRVSQVAHVTFLRERRDDAFMVLVKKHEDKNPLGIPRCK